MHKYSQNAGSFIVVAHYAGEPATIRSFSLNADSPIKDIFASLWPNGVKEIVAGTRFAKTPIRIEIVPDESSIPAIDESNPFTNDGPIAAA